MTSAPTSPGVTSVVSDGVGVLTLSRPERRNALSTTVMRELTAALRELGAREDVRAIVLGHQGPAFSAGHDLAELVGADLEDERTVFAVCTELMAAVHEVPQPVVAAVTGMAVAAGCQLAATCDLVVAGDSAVFGTPGVRIGLFCSTPMVAVTRAVGRKRAMQMLLTGDVVTAQTAADWGLVNVVVPAAEVDATADALARRIASASPLTLRVGKQAFYQQVDLTEADAYEQMRETMARNAVTCDAQEGMSAFLAKRTPVWQGR